MRLQALPEASGIAASRRNPGVLWAHNDSGEPVVFALDEKGSVIGRVRVSGAKVEDWEDIAVGPCSQGSCLYVADIGDNDTARNQITIYRAPEPSPRDAGTASVEAIHAEYPDGAHDAEALFVTPDADLFVITKGDPGPVAIYRFPRPLRAGARLRLERVAMRAAVRDVPSEDRPTAADATQDGQWVAVRTTHWVAFYRTADLTSGRWRESFRIDVSVLKERRGEGIALAGNGAVFLVGEGGLGSDAGTFGRLACTPDYR